MFDSVYSINYLFSKAYCFICQSQNPDFVKGPSEFYHLTCYLNMHKSESSISSFIPQQLYKPSHSCSLCDDANDTYLCETCNKFLCLVCCFSKPESICCLNFSQEMNSKVKHCQGCLTAMKLKDFYLDYKCSGHDYLCKKCFNLGLATSSCIFGCPVPPLPCSLTQCGLCCGLGLRYLGPYSCVQSCELCELCFYKSFLSLPGRCGKCRSPLSRAG